MGVSEPPQPQKKPLGTPKQGRRLSTKNEKTPKYGPAIGNSSRVLKAWKEIVANKAAGSDTRPGGAHIDTWETGGALTLFYDRKKLFAIAEDIIHWVKWFPGCKRVKLLKTKLKPAKSLPKTATVPKHFELVFGSHLENSVRFKLLVQPGRRVDLIHTPSKTVGKWSEEYVITWEFKDQLGSSAIGAMDPPNIIGTTVNFYFRVRSYRNVVLNCEQTWGRGSNEESQDIIRQLGERAAFYQQGPTAEEDMPMLVRRQPGRNLTMRERGNQLIRRVKADGADDLERERLHQRFAPRDYSLST